MSILNIFSYINEYLFNTVYNTNKNSNNKDDNNKFYYLSLIKEKDTYTIHGLWPQYNDKDYPTFCKKVDFSIDKLKPIINNLNKYWCSNKGDNDDFWKHEYEKHGSCVFSDIDEFTYFNITLNLYYEVMKLNIADNYYNKEKNDCLIPVGLDFKLKL